MQKAARITRGQMLIRDLDKNLEKKAAQRIELILRNPGGVPNGKGKRTKLSPAKAEKLKSELVYAVGQAAVFAAHGPLPNRVKGIGRPPDNAVFIFIDDIIHACKVAGLKPGLRYVSDTESLPVRLYIELASLLWPETKAPRRVFERWQRHQRTLVKR